MRELSLLGISHTLFGIILLSAKEKKEPFDYLLILWISVLFLPFFKEFSSSFNAAAWGDLRFINQSFTLLNGPLLYIYIKEVARHEESPAIRYWPHLLPFLLFYVLLLLEPAPLLPGRPAPPAGKSIFLIRYFGQVNVIIYLLYAAGALSFFLKHSRKIKETFAYRNRDISLLWIVFLPFLFILLVLIIVLVESTDLRSIVDLESLHLLMYLIFTLYLIFFGLRQKLVFPAGKEPLPGAKAGSKGSEIEAQLLEKIQNIMAGDKLYKNPSLSVYDLAEAMNMSRHRVSSLLNDNLAMNFFQFVNQYRLEEIVRRLKEDTANQHNILELAFDSGFNSKSSFNSLFKKKYGITPSQFKKSLRS